MEFVIPLAMPMSSSKKDSRFTQMMVVPPLAQNLDETGNDLSDLFAKLTANDRSSFSDSGEPNSDSPKSTNQSLTEPFANQAKPDCNPSTPSSSKPPGGSAVCNPNDGSTAEAVTS